MSQTAKASIASSFRGGLELDSKTPPSEIDIRGGCRAALAVALAGLDKNRVVMMDRRGIRDGGEWWRKKMLKGI